MEDLRELLVKQLQDMYSAEEQILEDLPIMIATATDKKLKSALTMHEEETSEHVQRLLRATSLLDETIGGEICQAMRGLLVEGRELISSTEEGDARDAAIIASAQKVEHYEMATYGTLVTWARTLGEDEVADILEDTLAEEKDADEELTKIASGGLFTSGVNREAAKT